MTSHFTTLYSRPRLRAVLIFELGVSEGAWLSNHNSEKQIQKGKLKNRSDTLGSTLSLNYLDVLISINFYSKLLSTGYYI